MNRRDFLKALGAAAAAPALDPSPLSQWFLPGQPAAGRRPNIIFVLCDDLGYGDVGVFWQNRRQADNRLLTPHLDRAIAEGTALTQHLTVSPVCAPARASLMTGKNQGHCNLRDNAFDHAIDPHMTLATVLKAAGYATWHLGKWGIGGGYESGTPRTAMACQAGFDYSYGYPAHLHGHTYYHCFLEGQTDINSAHSHAALLESYSEEAWRAAGSPEGFERDQQPPAKRPQFRRPVPNAEARFAYDTDLFTAKAKQLIRDHRAGAQRDTPFFLHLCYTTVHGSGNPSVCDPAIENKAPFHVPAGPYPALRDDDALWGGGAALDGALNGTAQTANTWIHPDFRAYATESERRYATSVRRLDDAIGDLLHFLRLQGIERDTLFVFTSDNGPAGEYLQPRGLAWVRSIEAAGPFRGMKRWSYEGGLREPTFVRWPGTVPAGESSDLPCNLACWMPTFAEAAGLPAPAHSDGVSLLPELVRSGRQLPCRLYTEYVDGGSGQGFGFEQSVRQDQWVLVRNSARNGGAPELYDLDADPAQARDLAAERPETVARLLPLLAACRIPAANVPDASGAPTFACTPHPGRDAADREPIPAFPDDLPLRHGAWLYRGEWPWVPDFRTLMPVHSVPAERVSGVLARLPERGAGALVHGCLDLPEETDVAFEARGLGGCHLWVHEAHILEYEAGDCAGGRRFTLRLAKGRHPWRACLTAPLVALSANGNSLL